MLRHSFIQIRGVGPEKERALWALGLDWDSIMGGFGCQDTELARVVRSLERPIREANERLAEKDLDYFARVLPQKEYWRLYPDFRERAVFLDIETTGGRACPDYVTVATLYDGHDIMVFTAGQNMHDLPEVLGGYAIAVTFNGKSFDVPFLERVFDRKFNLLHLDLLHLFHSLGCKGGLKKLEKQFGMERREYADLDGYAAVLLWEWHLKGMKGALETLTAYNILDTVNLERLMALCYNMKCEATGIPGLAKLEIPAAVMPPVKPYPDVIGKALEATAWKQNRH